jgi:hypothetical protein
MESQHSGKLQFLQAVLLWCTSVFLSSSRAKPVDIGLVWLAWKQKLDKHIEEECGCHLMAATLLFQTKPASTFVLRQRSPEQAYFCCRLCLPVQSDTMPQKSVGLAVMGVQR